jgi:DNA-binding LacI/PurR family transcriptional regulator
VTKKKRVTLRDVAKEAGVSPTAVSFAYNAPHQLSQATRERILATAATLGYQPHPVARTLATGRTNTVGVVMPASLTWVLNDPFFHIFLGEIATVCDENNLRILLVSGKTDLFSETLATIAADGFLLAHIHRENPLSKAAEKSRRPVVLLDGDEHINAPLVNLDDRGGAYQAARYLLRQGHRHIAVATMAPRPDGMRIPVNERRMEGYRQAVADAGLPPETLEIVYARGVLSAGHESFRKIWALEPRPTAVLCTSDVRALGILSGARAAGIAVPEQLAVVGFDDLPDAEYAVPPLTTVHHDIAGRSRLAAQLLIQLIEEQPDEFDRTGPIIHPVELVVRQSA